MLGVSCSKQCQEASGPAQWFHPCPSLVSCFEQKVGWKKRWNLIGGSKKQNFQSHVNKDVMFHALAAGLLGVSSCFDILDL